ncbi:hypothetical protein D3C85_386380 [compost metagenome]
MWVVGHRVVGHCADKTQGAFGADHQVTEDIQRLIEIDQGVERQAGGVLQPVFMPDLGRQCGVGAGLPAQFGQLFEQAGMGGAEARHAQWVFAIQNRAVGQYQAYAGQGVIAVVRGAAAHAAGIVGDDAADLAGVDRGRVGADLALERCQHGVGLGANHSGLQPDLEALAADFAAVPVIAQDDQYRVADRLTGQAGAGGAEGHRHPFGTGQLEQGDHFQFGFDPDHQLRNQPIEAGVGAEGQGREGVVETPFLGDQALDGGEEGDGQAHGRSGLFSVRWAARRVGWCRGAVLGAAGRRCASVAKVAVNSAPAKEGLLLSGPAHAPASRR